MLVDVALTTQAFVGVLPTKYYDMREFDKILFLIQLDAAIGLQGQVAIINDTDGQGSDPKVLKTFAATTVAADPEVWSVEVKAEDLEADHPFVRIDPGSLVGVNGEQITVVAALACPHYAHENKLGADVRFKSWDI